MHSGSIKRVAGAKVIETHPDQYRALPIREEHRMFGEHGAPRNRTRW